MSKKKNTATYLQEARQLISTLDLRQCESFNAARKKVFNSIPLQELMSQNLNQPIVALSPGTSRATAFPPLLQQVTIDWMQNKFYRDYQTTAGSLESRQAVAILESAGLHNKEYQMDDVAFTEGSTGAITAVMEAIARTNQGKSEVLIASPTYYLYKYAAEYLDLPYKEINLLKGAKNSLTPLIEAVTKKTALIIVCNPSNPCGEVYDESDMKRLLKTAKHNQALVLADELFAELVFENNKYLSFGALASQMGVMENLVTIKGYSKSKNLAALRVGYVLTRNQMLMQQILKVLEQRQCFPVASAFTGLISLDAFLQLAQRQRSRLNRASVAALKQKFVNCSTIREKSISQLEQLAKQYKQYFFAQQSQYENQYKTALDELGDLVSAKAKTIAAFNTFVRIDALRQVDQLDFTIELYLHTGVKIEVGPCFGWTQSLWEKDPQLGFWVRLTFAQERDEYIEGLRSFKSFVPKYVNNL